MHLCDVEGGRATVYPRAFQFGEGEGLTSHCVSLTADDFPVFLYPLIRLRSNSFAFMPKAERVDASWAAGRQINAVRMFCIVV